MANTKLPLVTVRRVGVFSLAKVALLMGAFFGLLLGAALALYVMFGTTLTQPVPGMRPFELIGLPLDVALLAYTPILGAVLGLLGGLLGGVFYNALASVLGGVKVDIS